MPTRLRGKEPPRDRLNLYIHSQDRELWDKARLEATKLGVSLSSLVAEAMDTYLHRKVDHVS